MNGFRPGIPEGANLQGLDTLIHACWDADRSKRPTADNALQILNSLFITEESQDNEDVIKLRVKGKEFTFLRKVPVGAAL